MTLWPNKTSPIASARMPSRPGMWSWFGDTRLPPARISLPPPALLRDEFAGKHSVDRVVSSCRLDDLKDALSHVVPCVASQGVGQRNHGGSILLQVVAPMGQAIRQSGRIFGVGNRSEEHTSELQSHSDLVCRLLLEKK